MDVETEPVTLADIEEAAERIKGRVRRTPCLRARFNRTPLHAGELLLKLECLQVTGSFKARGARRTRAFMRSAASSMSARVTGPVSTSIGPLHNGRRELIPKIFGMSPSPRGWTGKFRRPGRWRLAGIGARRP